MILPYLAFATLTADSGLGHNRQCSYLAGLEKDVKKVWQVGLVFFSTSLASSAYAFVLVEARELFPGTGDLTLDIMLLHGPTLREQLSCFPDSAEQALAVTSNR